MPYRVQNRELVIGDRNMRRLAQTADRRCREEAAENEISVKTGKTPENARGQFNPFKSTCGIF
jgi:hypothetical protein